MSIFNMQKLRRYKTLIRSKSFLGSILFAAALWGYTSLNSKYTPYVTVPLTIKLPSDKAIENELPESISVKVEGGGWQLFYLIFFNSAKQCFIDLSDRNISESEYIVNRSDILKSIQNIIDVEPKDVLPETMVLKIGKITTYTVPVNPVISVTPKSGFLALNEIVIEPDSIEITGNDKIVSKVQYWNTKKVTLENLFKKTTVSIPLSDSLSSIIKLSNQSVNATVFLEQSADLKIYDIPISIKGGTLPRRHKLVPDKISITVYGGIEQLSELNHSNVSSFIDYQDLVKDSTGILKPKIVIDKKFSKFSVSPRFVYHFIKSK